MDLMQMLMQGQQPGQMPQFNDMSGNPMAKAMFGNMPFLNLPQPQGPGPMPQGRQMGPQQPLGQPDPQSGGMGPMELSGGMPGMYQNQMGQQFRKRPNFEMSGGTEYMPANDYRDMYGR